MGDVSSHFSRHEFRCHHCGRLDQVYELKHVVHHLELLRLAVRRPLIIVSGYRCAQHPIERAKPGGPGEHNRSAVDLKFGVVTIAEAAAAGFTGIGSRRGYATHVDLGRPRRWRYR